MTWPDGGTAWVRLVRWFQAPAIDPRVEALGLRLDDVPGLVAVMLNGTVLALPGPDVPSLWLELPAALPARNRLELDVEVPNTPGAGPWGQVALVIRPRDPGEGGP
jgi:hypothetical protein